MTETETGEARIQVVNEVPDTLKRLTLFITKAFYGLEHFVLVDYLQRNICVKEDQLREITKMDARVLRQLLVQMKVDKIIKERVVPVENPAPNGGKPGKPRRVNYYFVNYKAVLNVARYKIDHMRQKLESREKNDVNKASYKCTRETCGATYQSLEINQLIDMETGAMKCWRCQGLVDMDQAAGPTDLTRTSLAKFNDQMAGLFSMLQSLDGVRLAQHLLEPPIQNLPTSQEEPDDKQKKFLQVGAKAFNGHQSSRKDIFNQEVTVNIINGSEKMTTNVVEEKESVPWLSAQSNFDSANDGAQKPMLGHASSSAPVLSTAYVQEQDQHSTKTSFNTESSNLLIEIRDLLRMEAELIKEYQTAEEDDDEMEVDDVYANYYMFY